MSFRNYLKKVEIYSTNRALENYVEKGEEMLSVDIEKLPSFNRGLKEGIKEGIEKGKQETLKLSVKAFHSVGYDAKKIAILLHISEDEVHEFLK